MPIIKAGPSTALMDGPDLVEPFLPSGDCAFLAKVRHSAFFGTPLEYLLHCQEISTVVLAGQVTEQCVLYSALDAYVHEFHVRVAQDCVAAIHPELGEAALRPSSARSPCRARCGDVVRPPCPG
ncbi:hypothetical protein Acor_57170 [Acrocarpospora corrugata]|uniref:Isochorismatase-like domain-containing protein n=1 Tax=Acrocarpospora corrugata TaxID=35763 RepID=A0A5M3W9C1_9ACTN|nr:isochorismatase family cysteine hydrolase [Acrocarpospora corrugata]GES03651.1 hypothetical protein Acor_57170 [Acrocarpospora corrugata]